AVQVSRLGQPRNRPPADSGRAHRENSGRIEVILQYTMQAGVAVIALDRPAARNALNLQMCEELRAAALAAAADPHVRVVFVRGNGPVFCAGADVKERTGMTENEVRERRMKGFAAYAALEALPMPAIALVQGAALGSGVEIAAACDFIVAAP